MATANDIIKWVEENQGWAIHHEEGIHHGAGDVEITGVTVCWKASPRAIDAAGKRGDNLIIGHESLHYPYYIAPAKNTCEPSDGICNGAVYEFCNWLQ
jgi:hypothetical protein